MGNPYTGKEIRKFKVPECTKHQPYCKLIKVVGLYGWFCPECDNFMDEAVRQKHIERINA